MAINVAILGGSGYAGAELIRILRNHAGVRLQKVFANTLAGDMIDNTYGRLRTKAFSGGERFEKYAPSLVEDSEIVFLALPSGESMLAASELAQLGKRVIDLSGDFRLQDVSEFQKFYKHEHSAEHLLPQAVYGLPEWNRERITTAKVLSNPGCYPTSAILPLAPVVKAGLIETTGIAITSMSGVSGAGRKASIDLSFAEVNESVKAYKIGSHQHIPEIRSVLSELTGEQVSISFVPHLIPITRGIYTTIHATPKEGTTIAMIEEAFSDAYANEPFVRCEKGLVPEIRHVAHTNFIDMGYHLCPESGKLILLSTIDNLVKGAAGQAVQNMNIMCGFNEWEGFE